VLSMTQERTRPRKGGLPESFDGAWKTVLKQDDQNLCAVEQAVQDPSDPDAVRRALEAQKKKKKTGCCGGDSKAAKRERETQAKQKEEEEKRIEERNIELAQCAIKGGLSAFFQLCRDDAPPPPEPQLLPTSASSSSGAAAPGPGLGTGPGNMATPAAPAPADDSSSRSSHAGHAAPSFGLGTAPTAGGFQMAQLAAETLAEGAHGAHHGASASSASVAGPANARVPAASTSALPVVGNAASAPFAGGLAGSATPAPVGNAVGPTPVFGGPAAPTDSAEVSQLSSTRAPPPAPLPPPAESPSNAQNDVLNLSDGASINSEELCAPPADQCNRVAVRPALVAHQLSGCPCACLCGEHWWLKCGVLYQRCGPAYHPHSAPWRRRVGEQDLRG